MLEGATGYKIKPIIVQEVDLRKCESVIAVVDVSILPKAIGGQACSIDDQGNEDGRNVRGVECPKLSAFMEELELS